MENGSAIAGIMVAEKSRGNRKIANMSAPLGGRTASGSGAAANCRGLLILRQSSQAD
jgi:hypothetical protein